MTATRAVAADERGALQLHIRGRVEADPGRSAVLMSQRRLGRTTRRSSGPIGSGGRFRAGRVIAVQVLPVVFRLVIIGLMVWAGTRLGRYLIAPP